MDRINVGIIGAGNISGVYIQNLLKLYTGRVSLKAITNLSPDKARLAAQRYGIEFVESAGKMFERKDIDTVLNLTPPMAHFAVAEAALEAGKHVYNEKPLCQNLEQAETLLKTAHKKNLRLGCAPDTFMGAGLQTARKLLDEGLIGEVIAGCVFFLNRGPESWHPSPEFYYRKGGGPLFDMGPYYINALVNLLGPVKSVSGSTSVSFAERTIGSIEKSGTKIKVETPTHIQAALNFENGAHVSMVMSFDVWSHSLPFIEIYGSEGTIRMGDPNYFNSPVEVCRRGETMFHEVKLLCPFKSDKEAWLGNNNWRGIGLADMAAAIRENRPHRARGELALHVVEVMGSILESGSRGTMLTISHDCARPQALDLF